MVTYTDSAPHYPPQPVHAVTTSQQVAARHPQWRWVYGLLPLLIGLLLATRWQPLTRSGHIVVQCAIVLLVYGLLTLWLYANQTAPRPAKPASPSRALHVVHVAMSDRSSLDGLANKQPSLSHHNGHQA